MFWIGYAAGTAVAAVIALGCGLCCRRRQAPRRGAAARQAQMRNFLHYDGTQMPRVKEEKS